MYILALYVSTYVCAVTFNIHMNPIYILMAKLHTFNYIQGDNLITEMEFVATCSSQIHW